MHMGSEQALEQSHLLRNPLVRFGWYDSYVFKVLILDNDPDMVSGTRLALEKRGYSVITALSALEGQGMVEAERPDLILLEIMIPAGTEGFHFVWRLRKHSDPVLRNTPVVVVSAIHRTTELRLYPELADRDYAPGEFLPVEAFLDKPVDLPLLAHTVERVLTSFRRA